VKLRPITDPKQVLNEEIRRHALDGSKATVTRNFVAIEEGREVAFVSLDIFPLSQQPLVLYTLAVPALLREKGIGSRVLAEVNPREKVGVFQGFAEAKITRRRVVSRATAGVVFETRLQARGPQARRYVDKGCLIRPLSFSIISQLRPSENYVQRGLCYGPS
jgi:hypothetical protein